MSSLRPEFHVAQQLRRDKLRVQNSSQHLQEFPSNLEQLSLHPGFNLDLLQVRNVRNGNMLDDAAALYSSEMITFSSPSNPLSTPRNPVECQELMMAQYVSRDQQCEPRNLGANWVVNYNNNSSNNNAFLPSDMNSNVSSEIVNREIHKQLVELQYPPSSSSSSPPIYHNALQDMAYGVWGGNTFHHPSYENQVNNNELRFGGSSSSTNLWTNSTTTNTQLGFKKINELHDTSNPHQGLSLSLSSNTQSNSKPCVSHFDEGSASDKIPTMKMNVPSNNNTVYRSVGPLGPFTGYATILKSSRFLKPCQQLLDEWCCESGSKFSTGGVNDVVPEWVSRDVRAASTSDVVVAAKGGANSGASSSVLYGSNQNNNNINISNNINNSVDGGAASSFCISSRPECQKNKAKLLYMQEEVTRRYKQYHQQMQMVVQSFESVAGLSSATPYVSLALKSVSKHFKSLKNAISDQLKFTCEVLGEDLSIPTTSTSSKFDNNMARLRSMDQSDQKNKTAGGPNINFFEPQQHVWRPQRGLPERSVAILKAWLFEHFLHPYPTDTDKHMLATQTGLSRNQVSNWFINARVRVWKPMVEEIHMLETKGAATEAHQTSDQGASASEGSNQPKGDHHQPASRFGLLASHPITEKQFQCLEMGSSSSAGNDDHIGMDEEEQWNQEKRSKLECQRTTTATPSMDGTIMGFMPYRRGGGLDGLSSVSLTLGLRHGVEGVQQQQQQLQQEEELRRQFGGHMIHDFVG